MTAKLTKAYIEKLQPAERPQDYPDSALVGFLIRVQPTGRKMLLNMAVADGVIEVSPLERLPLIRDGQARIRYLDEAEVKRLRAALHTAQA